MFPNFLCDFSLHQQLAIFLKGTSIFVYKCTVRYIIISFWVKFTFIHLCHTIFCVVKFEAYPPLEKRLWWLGQAKLCTELNNDR